MEKKVVSIHDFNWPGSSDYDWSFNENITEDGKLFLLAMNYLGKLEVSVNKRENNTTIIGPLEVYSIPKGKCTVWVYEDGTFKLGVLNGKEVTG